MSNQSLSPAQQAELVARIPLLFQYYAHMNSTLEAVDRYYDPWQFTSILIRPVLDELVFRLEWYSRFLRHLVHDLDEPARNVEDFRAGSWSDHCTAMQGWCCGQPVLLASLEIAACMHAIARKCTPHALAEARCAIIEAGYSFKGKGKWPSLKVISWHAEEGTVFR